MDKILQRLTGTGLTTAFAAVLFLALSVDANAQIVTGACQTPEAQGFLDVNNVRASIYTNGNLFWRGSTATYEVPKGGGSQAIFTSGFWLAGKVGSDIRVAAARYGRYQFWTGPIFDGLQAPPNCNVYDKIWKINRADVRAFNSDGVTTPDMLSWPTGLGAPTISPVNEDGSAVNADGVDNDKDGEIDEADELRIVFDDIASQPLASRIDRKINLAAGERPDVLGDQMLWWINNDIGNDHTFTDGTTTETSEAIGVEVHNTAFAFNQSGDIGNTTFYKVKMYYKGTVPFTDAYIGLFSDPDLGNFDDDFVGSDSLLGLGYVYNADNDDEGGDGYGLNPPAAGYDFFQGPIVPSVGDTAQVSGVKVPDFRNLSMTTFMYYNNGGAGLEYTDPNLKTDYYNYMAGLWKDGSPIKASGDGFNTTATQTTTFMFPDDPTTGEFWTEFNNDGSGTANEPADRRFVMAAGPFTVQPGDIQEIVYGIVWARGGNNLDSVTKLKIADRKAQATFDANFLVPDAPDAPVVTIAELNSQILLTWDNPAGSNNFLDAYHEFVPSGDPDNPFYDFEGYEVWGFDSQGTSLPGCLQLQTCRRLAVFDVANGVTNVIDDANADGLTELIASGTDAGVAHSISFQGLTNYKSYYYGVRAYGYNSLAAPAVLYSPMVPFEAIPTKTHNNLSAAAVAAAGSGGAPDLVATLAGIGDGSVVADVVNPAAIRACEYRVVFYSLEAPAGKTSVESEVERQAFDSIGKIDRLNSSANKSAAGETTYDIFCGTEKVFNGSATGEPIPQKAKVAVIDGLEFSVQGPDPGIKNFLVVANAAGPVDPPEMGTFAFNNNGFPMFEGSDRPDRARQQVQGGAWGFNHGGGADNTYATFLSRVLRGENINFLGIADYEMRFTAGGGIAVRAFEDGAEVTVPFELWRTGVSTPNDPSDDVRLIPIICESGCGAGTLDLVYDIGGDSGVSGGVDDPFTDWIYWYTPTDESPGSVGYDAWVAGTGDAEHEVLARTVLVNWNGGEAPPYTADLPEEGTVFRIVTLKPNQPGDVYSFSTVGLEPTEASQAEKIARLDEIGVVPNPYMGASSYERSQITDQVRFTNMPDAATIRVYTLNGSLLRTLRKNSVGQESLAWDVTTEEGLPMASGMYLIHVEVPGVGSKVIKFGYVKKVTRLNTF